MGREDKIAIQIPTLENNHVTTKRNMLSYLGKIYNRLRIISPTNVKGREIYRNACDETKGWNAEVPRQTDNSWIKGLGN